MPRARIMEPRRTPRPFLGVKSIDVLPRAAKWRGEAPGALSGRMNLTGIVAAAMPEVCVHVEFVHDDLTGVCRKCGRTVDYARLQVAAGVIAHLALSAAEVRDKTGEEPRGFHVERTAADMPYGISFGGQFDC